MLTVQDTIDAYHAAIANDDRLQSSKLLESLESETFRNEDDWRLIQMFCEQQGLHARLQIITKKLMASGAQITLLPVLVLVKLLLMTGEPNAARKLVDEHLIRREITPDCRWDFIDVLFRLGNYEECLGSLRAGMTGDVDQVNYSLMEIRTLWKLNQKADAKKKHLKLINRLGANPRHWLWYSSVGLEIGQLDLSKQALKTLAALILDEKALIDKHIIWALNEAGLVNERERIIRAATPANYKNTDEMLYIFDIAKFYGIHATARNFAAAYLQNGADARRGELAKFLATPAFLSI